MRVIIAARLSQLAGQTGIESQDKLSREWAESRRHTVVAVIPDRKSGTVPPWKRPNLRPWVEDPIKLAQYDAVVGLAFDRLSRGDKKSTTDIEQWARDHSKELLTVDGLRFPCEGEDGIRWDIAARLAHAEWLRASERYRRMQAYLRDNGWLVGRPPFGYQIVGVDCGESPCVCRNDRKRLEPHPVTGEIVRKMADRYLGGETLLSIARWLDSEGVPCSNATSKSWAPKIVGDILRSETLAGKRKDAAGKVILTFDPLISTADWRKLQTALNANSRRRGPARENPALLAGVAYCGKCDGIMHYRRIVTRRQHGEYVWVGYRCDGTPKHPSKCRNMIAAASLEAAVNDAMAGFEDEPHWVTEVIPGSNHEDALEDNAAEIASLDPDSDDYAARHAELMTERRRLRDLPAVPDRVEGRIDGFIGNMWAGLDATGRHNLLVDLGWRWLVTAGPRKGDTPTVIIDRSDYHADLAKMSGLPDVDAYFAATD